MGVRLRERWFVVGLFSAAGCSSASPLASSAELGSAAVSGSVSASGLVGGTLVMLGLGSRTAALLCSGEMAYAYFGTHAPKGLIPLDNGGELAAFYCWAFLLLVFTGPGALSLDRLFLSRRARQNP
ncbi:hypothetical protein GCM10023080_065020 [Streptomyces pseudoechinosporeus]